MSNNEKYLSDAAKWDRMARSIDAGFFDLPLAYNE